MQFRDLKIFYKDYEEDGGKFGEGGDPLIIQNVPLWARLTDSTLPDSPVEDSTCVEGALEEGTVLNCMSIVHIQLCFVVFSQKMYPLLVETYLIINWFYAT